MDKPLLAGRIGEVHVPRKRVQCSSLLSLFALRAQRLLLCEAIDYRQFK